MARTSVSHPLQIAEVSAGFGMGKAGLTFCPGKRQPAALTGAWDRDLGLDLRAIADWGASTVVTLLEAHELVALNVSDLGERVRAHHMEWLHLPITDVSTPTDVFEADWARVGHQIRSKLTAGFNVLVHCKGGLGRAGMVASRILIDAGIAPATALDAVRTVRPGAVETAAQERYVLALRPALPLVVDTSTAAVRDRAVGALLGLAVGDALGTTLEFSQRDSKPPVTDIVGGGPFKLKPGEWTDDTAMALALAESLVAHPDLDERDLMGRFLAWFRRGEYSCTGTCFDIGITTRSALTRFEQTGDPVAGSTDPNSAGNGSLMRLAPVAIAHWRDRAKLANVAARQSATTHGAPEAVSGCVAFASLLADAIAGKTIDQVLAPVEGVFAKGIKPVMAGSWRGMQRDEIKSSGYVVHSLEAALWCVARTSDFRAAVTLAANLGDDADTVAAITGQLAGAIYGAGGIPTQWLDKLAWRDRLTQAAEHLLA